MRDTRPDLGLPRAFTVKFLLPQPPFYPFIPIYVSYDALAQAQAIGATTPAFVAVLALVMMGQRETRGVYLSLVPVMAGLVVATGAEPSQTIRLSAQSGDAKDLREAWSDRRKLG